MLGSRNPESLASQLNFVMKQECSSLALLVLIFVCANDHSVEYCSPVILSNSFLSLIIYRMVLSDHLEQNCFLHTGYLG